MTDTCDSYGSGQERLHCTTLFNVLSWLLYGASHLTWGFPKEKVIDWNMIVTLAKNS